jgi:hypothetical protein
MISSAPALKHILQKLNILGQRQITQLVPSVSDCLGHFVPIYCTLAWTKNPKLWVGGKLWQMMCRYQENVLPQFQNFWDKIG